MSVLFSLFHHFCISLPIFTDYVRIILNLASFYNMTRRPLLTVALYFTGGIILDVADGVSARYFDQCK